VLRLFSLSKGRANSAPVSLRHVNAPILPSAVEQMKALLPEALPSGRLLIIQNAIADPDQIPNRNMEYYTFQV
jgi:hypothetical protein